MSFNQRLESVQSDTNGVKQIIEPVEEGSIEGLISVFAIYAILYAGYVTIKTILRTIEQWMFV